MPSETLLVGLPDGIGAVDRLAWTQALVSDGSLRTVDLLLQLSEDADPQVREWAYLGLGQKYGDNLEDDLRNRIIGMLQKGTEDPKPAARHEAFRGLFKHRDLSRGSAFITELESQHVDLGIVDAVNELILLCDEMLNPAEYAGSELCTEGEENTDRPK